MDFLISPSIILFVIYLLIINFYTWFLFLYDKTGAIMINGGNRKDIPGFINKERAAEAFKNNTRISEKKLLMISLIGGATGELISMYQYKHKIRKPLFYILIPLMLLIQAFVVLYLIFR